MQTDLQKANTQLQAYNDLHTEARNSNLSTAEQTEAVKMMAAYKQNPALHTEIYVDRSSGKWY
jgi:hypothetical protein